MIAPENSTFASEIRHRGFVPTIAFDRYRLVHLLDFLRHDLVDPIDQRPDVRVSCEGAALDAKLFQGESLGAVVWCEVDLVSAIDKSPLAGFRDLQGIPQFGRRASRVPRRDDRIEIDLGPLSEPERHAHDGDEHQEADDQKRRGGADDESAGNRHL